MKLILVGPVPPPLGGISIHLRRLAEVLRSRQRDFVIYNESGTADAELQVLPMGSYKTFLLKVPFIKGDLFHFHSIDPRIRMLLGLYKALGKKVMLTVHGESLSQQLQRAHPVAKRLLLASLKRVDYIVCVSDAATQMLLQLGFQPDRVRTIPAYIHPVERGEDHLEFPPEVHRFMEQADFLIAANGFVRPLREGDLYGIDLLIGMVKELPDSVHLLFALLGAADQSAEERAYYERLKRRIADDGLSERIFIYEAVNTELYPLLHKSKLFVRPTRMDGYGVSVAEALYLNVPAIASDACVRPEGTILFESGNLPALVTRVRQVMLDYHTCKEAVTGIMARDYAADLIEIYDKLSGERMPAESKGIARANR
ncbi:glycosyltransferase family 4 protein [Paenibacillus sp. SAF-054]|uniref:glycosyltransferase family 4 protein n=1 Tax=unclassified Paenibacillus TaxID=185978 RepID=UPI003F7DE644